MTVANALVFIERGLEDSELRDRLNAATDSQALDCILVKENISFSAGEFDEAFHHRLTKCQAEEDANQLKDFKMWWELLSRILEPASCGKQCGGCA
jgi:hypothetical protein